MGFQTGLSGLDSASQSLDIIGNNISNAGTVGFKSSTAIFSDVYANSLSGAGTGPIGIGSKVAEVQQQFTQGNINTTNNPLDIAINGNGFFEVQNNGSTYYTRNGQFQQNSTGSIVTADNMQLLGYPANASGSIVGSTPVPLQISNAQLAPSVTSTLTANLNLSSSATVPATGVFNPADPTSYNNSTSADIYDSLGNAHPVTFFFIKTAVAGKWAVQATVDGTAATNVNLGAGAGNPINLQFNSSGAMTTAMPISPVQFTIGGGAASPLSLSMDLTGSTQFGAPFGVNSLSQNGFASGQLSGFNIGGDGLIVGTYTNGQTKNLGQIALATFANPQGLQPQGGSNWAATSASGLAVVGAPGSGSSGVLQSSALEQSNVDLTSELVNLITAQRNYQANAQTIKAQDTVLQTLVNIN